MRVASLGRILVIIPTYNEAENIEPITRRLRAAVPEAHILIADDNSPDGTGRLADELAAGDDHVHVLHRAGKEGLGAAYLASFRWGLERGYDVLVEHDADGSHQPEELPRLLQALQDSLMTAFLSWMQLCAAKQWKELLLFICQSVCTKKTLLSFPRTESTTESHLNTTALKVPLPSPKNPWLQETACWP
jgi:dolichol-phosphate mannosyltransferase